MYTERQADGRTDMAKVMGGFVIVRTRLKRRNGVGFAMKTSGVFASLTWHIHYTYTIDVTVNMNRSAQPNPAHVNLLAPEFF
jgi:hypothetical protein